jgi:hypothetical protein
MSQKAAIRRRKQYAGGYKHIAPKHRPKYGGQNRATSKSDKK